MSLSRPFCCACLAGVAGALPHPVTLSAVKFANRPCARLAEVLREAGRLAAVQGSVAPLRRRVAPLRRGVAPLRWGVAPLRWGVAPLRWGVAPLRPYILIWPQMSYWCPEVALKSPYQIGRELCIKISSAQKHEALILNKTKKE